LQPSFLGHLITLEGFIEEIRLGSAPFGKHLFLWIVPGQCCRVDQNFAAQSQAAVLLTISIGAICL
jgi:hypothetical protein